MFDLDGTLVDSHLDIANAVNAAMRALGRRERSPAEVKKMIGFGVKRLLAQALGTSEDAAIVGEARKTFVGAYGGALLANTRPYPGLIEALQALRARGMVLAAATNKPRRFTDPIMRAFFVGLVGAWASADEVHARKPDPAVVKLALERARLLATAPRDVAYVGDMAVDVQTARNFGCRSIGVLWGFSPEAVEQAKPDLIVTAPGDLSTLNRVKT